MNSPSTGIPHRTTNDIPNRRQAQARGRNYHLAVNLAPRQEGVPTQMPTQMTPNAPKSTQSAEMNAPETNELAGNHLPPEQKVGGSTPLGRTKLISHRHLSKSRMIAESQGRNIMDVMHQ
jgi:hypothetical protein